MLKAKKNRIDNTFFTVLKAFVSVKNCLFFFAFFFFTLSSSAQLTLNPALTPMQLVQTIVGNGYTVSNPKLVCPNGAIGAFTNVSSNIGVSDGILLTTGSINTANGANTLPSAGVNNGSSGDSDLDNLSGSTTFDGCALEFDLVPSCDSLIINYVFGSEEYPEYVNKQFNDVFAFFISGPGIAGTQNIALVPGTALPVSINNVNAGANAQYFVNNAGGGTIQYDGFTTPMYAKAAVQPCKTYHLKIVIADVVDGIFDSGVFIKGKTIDCVPITYNNPASITNAVTYCQNGSFTFCRSGPLTFPYTVKYIIAGTAVNGTDYVQIADSVVIPANSQCATVNVVPIPQPGSPGTKTINIIYQFGYCPIYDTLTLSITEPPPIDAGPDVEICSGDSIKIGVNPAPGFTYSWTPTTGLSNPNISNPKVSLINTTNADVIVKYVLSATNPQIGVCVLKDSMYVKVKPLPVAQFTVNPDHCVGSSVSFTDNSTAAISKNITNWYWTFGNSLFNNVQNPSITYSTAGVYTVSLTVTDNTGCVNDTSININVWPTPIANFTSSSPCQGDSVIFTNTSSVPGGGIIANSIWNFGDGSGLLSAFSPNHLYPTATNSYTVQLIVTSDKNCVGTVQKPIVINPKPVANFTAAAVCLGDSTKFFNSSSGINNSWTFGDGGTSIVRNPGHLYALPGTYTVTLITTSAFGCKDTVTKTVTVHDIPKFDFTAADTAGCPKFCTTFNALVTPGSDSIVSWFWLFNTGATGSGNQVQYCYEKYGTYSPSLIATSINGCKDTVTKPFYINVYPLPTAGFSIYPNPVSSFSPTTTITDYSSNDVVTWDWNLGDGTTYSGQNPPAHTYSVENDEYLINLIVTNNFGCKDTIFHMLRIIQESSVYVPNAFTPNEDGKNESFRPYCSGIYEKADYKMEIYDRWGNLLFLTKELAKGWDGKVNDRVCQQDVYVYKIVFTDKSDGTLLKRLNNIVTLIR